MEISFELSELVALTSPIEIRGDVDGPITGITSLLEATNRDLSFLGNAKYRSEVESSRAAVIFVPEDYKDAPASGQCLLVVKQPSAALALVCARVEQALWPRPKPGIHTSAVVDPEAKIDPSATIGPLCIIEAGVTVGASSHLQGGVFVGAGASIGEDCWLASSSHVASRCKLENRVRLHAGVVVGSDGFGYAFLDGKHEKVPQVGSVVIESDVEIGANSTLDRARFSRTVIGECTKIDNLVQVSHNVIVGKHCILCSQVGIAGSTILEDYVVLGGQVGVAGHITVAKGTMAAGRAGITAATEPGITVSGMPAMPYHLERRLVVLQRRLPELFKQVKSMSEDLEGLKKASAS
ncbi:MAG: UDP-3-O-(3-hydroxymyristoyl)glucosamine N-acyltransferase [Candidatus Synoicihabitans palmerolidicus]|nr:UDP-3-O-(3-hydroxymyristoyl)glucosamine N-acyltransferase [Candidatus Synoicihabitans palmerolidicus]